MRQLAALDRIEHRPVCYDEPTGRLFQELLMKPRTLGAQVLGGADQAMLVPEVQCARLSVGCISVKGKASPPSIKWSRTGPAHAPYSRALNASAFDAADGIASNAQVTSRSASFFMQPTEF